MANARQAKGVKVYAAIMEFFEGNEAKVDLWYSSPNPMLGGISPDDMIRLDRFDKLARFVEDALEANQPPEETHGT